ncbi:hypothetical protein C8R45DRAFT_1097177 [Mycena sanguinolenta]|nr:hypothetical protein C8R45DRAFT_1097177 [Mycena sanguinolenta]
MAHDEALIDRSQMGLGFSHIPRPCVEFSERHISVSDILRIVLLFLTVSDILKIVSLLLACVGFERRVAVSAVLYPPPRSGSLRISYSLPQSILNFDSGVRIHL